MWSARWHLGSAGSKLTALNLPSSVLQPHHTTRENEEGEQERKERKKTEKCKKISSKELKGKVGKAERGNKDKSKSLTEMRRGAER